MGGKGGRNEKMSEKREKISFFLLLRIKKRGKKYQEKVGEKIKGFGKNITGFELQLFSFPENLIFNKNLKNPDFHRIFFFVVL